MWQRELLVEMEHALKQGSETNRAALDELQARLEKDKAEAAVSARAQVAAATQSLVRRAEAAELALQTLRQATADRVATLQRQAPVAAEELLVPRIRHHVECENCAKRKRALPHACRDRHHPFPVTTSFSCSFSCYN